MTAVDLSARALANIERLAEFLLADAPHEAARTVALIRDAIDVSRAHLLIGRTVEHGLRELVISRGRSGTLALYTCDETGDRVIVHAIRHQREAGYV